MRTIYGLGLGLLLIATAPLGCGSDDDGGSSPAGGGTAGATGGASGSGGAAGSGGTAGSATGGSAGSGTGGTAGSTGDPVGALRKALQVSFDALAIPVNPNTTCTGTAPNFTACPCDGGGSFDLALGSPNTQTANACTDSASGLSYTGTLMVQLPSGGAQVSNFTVNMTAYGECTAATGTYAIDQSTLACSGNLSAMCPDGAKMVATLCTVSGTADKACDCN